MKPYFVAVVIACTLASVDWADAQTPPAAELATGIRQVEEGDLEGAIPTLGRAVEVLRRQGQSKDLALAHLYLGMARLGLDQPDRARAEMLEAWRNNRDMKLDSKKFSPRVSQLYEEVKKEAERGAAASRSEGAAPAGGFSGAGIAVGSRVRLRTTSGGDAVTGTLSALDARTIVVRSDAGSPVTLPVSTVTRVEVSRGKSSKGSRMLIGIVGGAVVGAALGYVATCNYDDEDCSSNNRSKVMAGGAVGGAVLGGLLARTTAKEQWEPVPGARVSIGLQGRGIWLAVRF